MGIEVKWLCSMIIWDDWKRCNENLAVLSVVAYQSGGTAQWSYLCDLRQGSGHVWQYYDKFEDKEQYSLLNVFCLGRTLIKIILPCQCFVSWSYFANIVMNMFKQEKVWCQPSPSLALRVLTASTLYALQLVLAYQSHLWYVFICS